eukprot:1984451-Pyramimonas_sp.AAC.1
MPQEEEEEGGVRGRIRKVLLSGSGLWRPSCGDSGRFKICLHGAWPLEPQLRGSRSFVNGLVGT